MSEKVVTVKYERGHSFTFRYRQTDVYCPDCGARSVWVEAGDGDYYVGPSWYCTACEYEFNYLVGGEKPNWQTRQIVAALRDEPPPPDPEGWPPTPDPVTEQFDALITRTLTDYAERLRG